ncbi:hypothetical protein [Flavobacterium sp. CAU 1735]|uniref:hypothetical protein n=1 Tax=Flavobacterium sp. CAU 1735 TaxID=3140361 RepID=UPI003260970A
MTINNEGYFLKCIKSKPVLLLVLSGILIRLVIFYLYRHVTLFPDSEGYIALGNQLATFDLSGYNGQRSPGYPLLLLLSGNNLSVTLLLQFTLGICTTVLIYKSMLLLRFTTVVAFFTALILNNWLHVIFYETAILTESLTLFMISLIITLYLKCFFYGNYSFKKMFVLSLAFGFLVLIKPFYFFLPFIFYVFPLFKKFSIPTILNKRMVIFIFPVISFFGWSYVTKMNTGYFVSTTFYGYNIAQNCVSFAEKTPDTFHIIRDIYVKNREMAKKETKDVAMSIWLSYDELRTATGLSFADLSFQLSEFSKTAIRNNPIDYLYQICISWIDFWKTGIYWNYPDFKFPLFNKCFIGLWCLQSAILQYLKLVFVLLFPIQLHDFFIRKTITKDLFFSVIIHTTALLQAMVTYGNNSRFSYPFEFLMVITVMLFFKRKGLLNH